MWLHNIRDKRVCDSINCWAASSHQDVFSSILVIFSALNLLFMEFKKFLKFWNYYFIMRKLIETMLIFYISSIKESIYYLKCSLDHLPYFIGFNLWCCFFFYVFHTFCRFNLFLLKGILKWFANYYSVPLPLLNLIGSQLFCNFFIWETATPQISLSAFFEGIYKDLSFLLFLWFYWRYSLPNFDNLTYWLFFFLTYFKEKDFFFLL
jgi:hypothetical protein